MKKSIDNDLLKVEVFSSRNQNIILNEKKRINFKKPEILGPLVALSILCSTLQVIEVYTKYKEDGRDLFLFKLNEKVNNALISKNYHDGKLVQVSLNYSSPDNLYKYSQVITDIKKSEQLTIFKDDLSIHLEDENVKIKTTSCDTNCAYVLNDGERYIKFTEKYLANIIRNLPRYGERYEEFKNMQVMEYKDGVFNKTYDLPQIDSNNLDVYLHRNEISPLTEALTELNGGDK